MSRVIMFSQVFPKHHPKKGDDTEFVYKIWKSLDYFKNIVNPLRTRYVPDEITDYDLEILKIEYWKRSFAGMLKPKHHTIRAGNRFKKGDLFSPRIWTGKPYASKQYQFHPDILITDVWPIEMDLNGIFSVNGSYISHNVLCELAKNDGLSVEDFIHWFMPNFNKPKEFSGQIITWSKTIKYL